MRKAMNESRQANFEFSLSWQSRQAKHFDRLYLPRINFWRDLFPGKLGDKLTGIKMGDTVSESFEAGILVEPYKKDRVYQFPKRKLNLDQLAENGIHFRVGRFYPRSVLSAVGFTSQDLRPFRVLENTTDHIVIDINHPLTAFPVTFTGTMLKALPDRFERGGASNDIGLTATGNGPGMQAAVREIETDFFNDRSFSRQIEIPDMEFYREPRLLDHIDRVAEEQVSGIYGRFLQPGMKILDLMASWNSHLPHASDNLYVCGLGLNEEELTRNPVLSTSNLHDLNDNPVLPYPENEFDLVVCTLSIEYLVDPIAVFKEICRILKPESPFVLTFTDRWFPPKVIRLWTELHSFERLGLVLSYFTAAEVFKDLHTESVRGYPRPVTDSYFHLSRQSDPIFAAWGFKEKR
jgi:SAM-dependent methyltransferase